MQISEGTTECVCEFINECPFFERHEGLENTVRTVKEVFCYGEKQDCALYQIAREIGIQHLPDELLPFDHLSVESILSQRT
ncbi:hypothetical protein EGM51_16235 [Verrucomicrobia bacterium S94]|nr:hypothetical protein EGM51_16235 [Verrucomicrobia bacterium S94]